MNDEKKICENIRQTIDEIFLSKTACKSMPADINQHLDKCSACKKYLEETKLFNSALLEWKSPEPDKSAQIQVLAKIAECERDKISASHKSSFFYLLINLLKFRFQIPAFAALLLFIFCLCSFGFNIFPFKKTKSISGSIISAEILNENNPAISKSIHDLVQTPQIIHSLSNELRTNDNLNSAYFLTSQKVNMIQPAIIVILGMPALSGYNPAALNEKLTKINNFEKIQEDIK